MTQEELEEFYLQKLTNLKELYDAVDNLCSSGYDGPFIGEDVRPIFEAWRKIKWPNQKNLSPKLGQE